MKLISTLILLLLTSCNALVKSADAIKQIGHDIIDDEIDEMVEEAQQCKENMSENGI